MSTKKKISEAQAIAELDEAIKAHPRTAKVRITAYLDGDVLDNLKKQAAFEDKKYQSLMNEILKSHFQVKSKISMADLAARITKLEKDLKKKKVS